MPKTRKFSDLLEPIKRDPVRAARMEEMKQAMRDAQRLGQIRLARSATQTDVAARMNVSQANISRIEHQDDLYLSTLRGYVEALGGELEVTAKFPDGETIKIA